MGSETGIGNYPVITPYLGAAISGLLRVKI
jgi:hypothetical protein